MDSEKQTSNPRPQPNSNLPAITLAVLIALIVALLYIGYEGIADNTKGSEEITNVPTDTTDQQANAQDQEPELISPEDVDTSTAPVPVDLSQAPAPPDESVADAPTEKTDKPIAEKPKEDKIEKPVAEKPAVDKPKADPVAEKPKPKEEKANPTPVYINPGGTTTRHTVATGETFYSIANRYNLKLSTLKELNPDVSETSVKSGVTRLNLKVKAIHTVGPGDVLRVVAEKYGVSKEAIMRANNKTKDIAKRGEKLIIPFAEKQ